MQSAGGTLMHYPMQYVKASVHYITQTDLWESLKKNIGLKLNILFTKWFSDKILQGALKANHCSCQRRRFVH